MEEKNNQKQEKEITNEDLARIIQNSLTELKVELKSDISELKTDIQVLKTDVAEIKTTVNDIQAELNKKVDKITHNTLDYRVEKLEKKFV